MAVYGNIGRKCIRIIFVYMLHAGYLFDNFINISFQPGSGDDENRLYLYYTPLIFFETTISILL